MGAGRVRRQRHRLPPLFPRCKDDFAAERVRLASFLISPGLCHFTIHFVYLLIFLLADMRHIPTPPPQKKTSYSAPRGAITPQSRVLAYLAQVLKSEGVVG